MDIFDSTISVIRYCNNCGLHLSVVIINKIWCNFIFPVYAAIHGVPSDMSKAYILHTLRWAPRLGHKLFCSWVTPYLVKQGLNAQVCLLACLLVCLSAVSDCQFLC